jgi:hypothetical protein
MVSDDRTTHCDDIHAIVLQYSSNRGYSSNQWPVGAIRPSKSKWDGMLTIIIALYVYNITRHAQVKSCSSSNEKELFKLSIIHICKIYSQIYMIILSVSVSKAMIAVRRSENPLQCPRPPLRPLQRGTKSDLWCISWPISWLYGSEPTIVHRRHRFLALWR